jgi:hypothetical protein
MTELAQKGKHFSFRKFVYKIVPLTFFLCPSWIGLSGLFSDGDFVSTFTIFALGPILFVYHGMILLLVDSNVKMKTQQQMAVLTTLLFVTYLLLILVTGVVIANDSFGIDMWSFDIGSIEWKEMPLVMMSFTLLQINMFVLLVSLIGSRLSRAGPGLAKE